MCFLEVKTYLESNLKLKFQLENLIIFKHKQTNISKQKTENLFTITKNQIHKMHEIASENSRTPEKIASIKKDCDDKLVISYD